jgi:hypothetical protein
LQALGNCFTTKSVVSSFENEFFNLLKSLWIS